MKLLNTATINKRIDEVWDVLGPNYARAGDWASAVYVSRARPGTPKTAGAPYAGRVCETSLGAFTESLEVYDPVNYQLAYSATGEKMPGFVRSLVNSWKLDEIEPGKTRVTMELNADIAFPFSLMMGWMMKIQFRKVLRESLEEFVHYVETGSPHPRKRKIDATKKAILAKEAFG